VLRFEEFVEQSRQAETVAGLAQQYCRAIREEGYENCVLTSLRGLAVGRVAWCEFPDGYAEAYMDRQWERIDPVLACTSRAQHPFSWSDVAEQTKLSKKQITFMNECRALKVHSGRVFPFHGPGQRLDVISISRRTNETPNPECSTLLHAVSMQTWTRFLELSRQKLFTKSDACVLTARELEILRWCKDGKTRRDIQEILCISRQTVDFHLTNLMRKLGASNHISAVVIAIQHGLIDV
jgi:LuxR family transcriptional regulator, quorum-sensing system regulator SolR